MVPCENCLGNRYCIMRFCMVVNDAELSSPAFLRSVRADTSQLALYPGDMVEWLSDQYCKTKLTVIDGDGRAVYLDTSVFEATDDEIDAGKAKLVAERMRSWFDDSFLALVPDGVVPRLRREAWERFRVATTIYACVYPLKARRWPRIIPANDNWPEPAANDNDPA